MDDIIKLLPTIIRITQYNEEVCEKASFAAWRSAVGETISRISTPQQLSRKLLTVAVIDDTWKKQLDEISSQIIFKLNTLLGSPLVSSIDFFVNAEMVKKGTKVALEFSDNFPLDAKITAAANKISDENLREKFLHTASKYLQAQKIHAEEKRQR